MEDLEDYDELRSRIAEKGDVGTVEMQVLRALGDHGRLGIHVRETISKKLAGLGIAHYPRELPQYQHELVRLYIRGTAMSDLIEAALNVSEAADQKLREAVTGEAEKALQAIREIVCES